MLVQDKKSLKHIQRFYFFDVFPFAYF